MDAFRKQLDQLMGANRNGDVELEKKSYSDRDVCRPFLCGMCPHELFTLTKMDLGPCSKEHSLRLRKEYEEAKSKGLVDYDRELENVLDKLIVECDRKIARSFKRLEDEEGASALDAVKVSEITESPESVELSKQIYAKMREIDELELQGKMDEKFKMSEELEKMKQDRADKQAAQMLDAFNRNRLTGPPAKAPAAPPAPPLDAKTQELVNEKLQKAEKLGEEGKVDEAQKLMEEVEAMKKRSAPRPADAISSLGFQITDQKLRVCDICGAFLSIFDSDRRLADHFGGKLHLGYFMIRDKLTQLRDKRRVPRQSEERQRDEDTLEEGEARRDRDRGKERDSLRDRARERYVMERERQRDRDRGRDGERYREREERDRGRDRDREWDRFRDKERYRERDRDRGWEWSHGRERDRGRIRERDIDDRRGRRSRSRS